MARKRIETWLALILLAPVGIAIFVMGLWAFMAATATPIHPSAEGVPSATAEAPRDRWAEAAAEARQIVRAKVAGQNLPGVSVAVAIDGTLVWTEGFGFADLEQRTAVAPGTRFRIGSASKMLTSAAVGLLLQQGLLKLDDEIQKYVPHYPKKKWPVTLRQLMAHTAGVRTDAGDEEPIHAHCDRTADVFPRFADADLLFEPGTRYRYSSYGWVLMSAAVEAAAGEPFFTFVRQAIFEPLGMTDTRADLTPSPTPGLATYYFPRFAADPRYGPQEPDAEDFSCFSGAGGFQSTAADLVRFVLAIDEGTLLTPATVALLQTSQRLPSGEETGYGLGWDLETVTLAGTQTPTVGYDGNLRDGPVMSLMKFPQHNIVVAVLSNISYADTPPIATAVAEAFLEHRARRP